jgi:pyruvate/2-oxoglutarate dehydrogenase complex dihydrolipoamide dehydrogenase (E3) component
MPELIRPDICVIGAGAGGVRAAAVAAGFGVGVVLVDKGELGRELVQGSRLPLSALIAAGRRAHTVAQAKAFGIEAGSVAIDFGRVRAHVAEVVSSVAPNLARERLAGLRVRTIKAAARFKDATTLVAGADIEIAARRFIIATGSAPAVPPIAGLQGTPHWTVDTIFELTACPAHLIVLGAGAIGLEFAQAFRRLGAAVTVIDAAAPLPQQDPECVAILLDQFAREGIAVRRGTVTRVDPVTTDAGPQVRVRLGDDTIDGSHFLIATGRWANVVGLGLDAAGIKYDERGIAVGRGLRTTNKRVYAIGDAAAGGPPEAHIAEQQADLVVRHALLRVPLRFDSAAAPRVTFTDPELAQTGLTEAQARQRRHRIGVLRWPYRENDRAVAERAEAGHIKVVTGRGGRVLGVSIVGGGAGELISGWTAGLGRSGQIREIAGMMVPYPTLAGIGKWAAAAYFMRGLTGFWVRRIIGLVRRFG